MCNVLSWLDIHEGVDTGELDILKFYRGFIFFFLARTLFRLGDVILFEFLLSKPL